MFFSCTAMISREPNPREDSPQRNSDPKDSIADLQNSPHKINTDKNQDEQGEFDIPLLSSQSLEHLSDEERKRVAIDSLRLVEEGFPPLSDELLQVRWKAAIILCEVDEHDRLFEVAGKALSDIQQRKTLGCLERPDIDLIIKLSLQELLGQAFLIKKEPAQAFTLWKEVLSEFESTASSVVYELSSKSTEACTETLAAAVVHLDEIQRMILIQRSQEVAEQKRELLREIERVSYSFLRLVSGEGDVHKGNLFIGGCASIHPHILAPMLGILARTIDSREEIDTKHRLLISRWEIVAPYLHVSFAESADASLHAHAGLAGLELLKFYMKQKKVAHASEVAITLLPHLHSINSYIGEKIEESAYDLLASADFEDGKDIEKALESTKVSYACVNSKLANLVQRADLYCAEGEFIQAENRILQARNYIDEMGERNLERECLAHFYKTAWLIASESACDEPTDKEIERIESLLRQMMRYTKFEPREFPHRRIIRAEAAANLAEIELKRGDIDSVIKNLEEAWESLREDSVQEPELNFMIASDCIGILGELPTYTPKEERRRDIKIFKFLTYAVSPKIVMGGQIEVQQIMDLANFAISLGHTLGQDPTCSSKQARALNLSMAKLSKTVVDLVLNQQKRSVKLLKIAKEFQETRVLCLERIEETSSETLRSERKKLQSIERELQRKEGFN